MADGPGQLDLIQLVPVRWFLFPRWLANRLGARLPNRRLP
jgi:hypothetical protein